MSSRKKIIITIDQKLYEKLKNHAIHFGDISHTIEDALEFYFNYEYTHIKKQHVYKSFNRSFTIYNEIIEFLKSNWMLNYPEIKTIPITVLYKTINELYGYDDRTIKKYMSIIKPYIKISKDNQVILS